MHDQCASLIVSKNYDCWYGSEYVVTIPRAHCLLWRSDCEICMEIRTMSKVPFVDSGGSDNRWPVRDTARRPMTDVFLSSEGSNSTPLQRHDVCSRGSSRRKTVCRWVHCSHTAITLPVLIVCMRIPNASIFITIQGFPACMPAC